MVSVEKRQWGKENDNPNQDTDKVEIKKILNINT